MKKTNVNSRYSRDKLLAERLGMNYTPFSGSRWESGKEDASDVERIMQAKSTMSSNIVVQYKDLQQVSMHAGSERKPLFVLDFVNPKISGVEFPEEQWVAIPIEDYKNLYNCYLRLRSLGKNFFN